MFLPEFYDAYLVVAMRGEIPHVVNHNLPQEEMNLVVSELRRRRETVVVLKQDSRHKLDSNFVCSSCRDMFQERGWMTEIKKDI